MTRSQQPALTLFAVGMFGLGVLALVYGDFALVLLVWAIVAAPKTRLPWTAFFISWAIGSAAWVVAQNTSH